MCSPVILSNIHTLLYDDHMKRITIGSTVGTLLFICFIIIILSGKNCDECFSLPVMMAKFIACGLVFFIGSIYFTSVYLKNEHSIFNLETLPLLETNEAASDIPFSSEATVLLDKQTVLRSPYLGLACVYYHSITEKQVGRGKNKKWVVTENLVNLTPFYIFDDRGKLKIDPKNLDSDFSGYKIDFADRTIPDPENSEIDCTQAMVRHVVGTSTKVLGITFTSSNLRRSEYILPPLTKVFVSGFLSKKNDELVLHEHPKFPLIISQKTKAAYIEEFYKGKNLVFLVHALVAIGFTITILSVNYFLNIQHVIIFYILYIGNCFIIFSILFTIYNRLTTLTQRAHFALSDIDIELKRRSEILPKIVELVKAYSTHEHELQQFISEMRVHKIFLDTLPAGMKIYTSPLTALVENYPTIKAGENFKNFMLSLVDTEERIVYARAFYNRNVRKLNTLIRQFPFIIIAYFFSMKEMPYVTITPEDAAAPHIKILN